MIWYDMIWYVCMYISIHVHVCVSKCDIPMIFPLYHHRWLRSPLPEATKSWRPPPKPPNRWHWCTHGTADFAIRSILDLEHGAREVAVIHRLIVVCWWYQVQGLSWMLGFWFLIWVWLEDPPIWGPVRTSWNDWASATHQWGNRGVTRWILQSKDVLRWS